MRTKKELTPEQEQAKRERCERFNGLVKQIAAMTDEQRAAISAKMTGLVNCEGRALTGRVNTILIYMQQPNATIVGGFHQWRKAGRMVRKGEHGISIFVPLGKRDENGVVDMGDEKHFTMSYVFDVSQTEEARELEAVAA